MKVELEGFDQDFHMRAVNEDGITVDMDGAPKIGREPAISNWV